MTNIYYFNITYRCNNSCLFCAANLSANSNGPEISISDFSKFIKSHNIGPHDRIIINGGEPTVHSDFWDFLKVASETGALIDLFTNGKKLAERTFAEKLFLYAPMHIRIPLFGASSEVHDRLTGFTGNFEKVLNSINNISNLCKEINNSRVTLEVKMLLSKKTVPENIKILSLLTNLYPTRPFGLSLNPLLVSDFVVKNSSTFIAPYRILMEDSVPMIEQALGLGWKLQLNLLPFCVYPKQISYLIPFGGVPKKDEIYSDPFCSFKMNKKFNNGCDNCTLKDKCNHFPDNYLKYMGESEIVPFRC